MDLNKNLIQLAHVCEDLDKVNYPAYVELGYGDRFSERNSPPPSSTARDPLYSTITEVGRDPHCSSR